VPQRARSRGLERSNAADERQRPAQGSRCDPQAGRWDRIESLERSKPAPTRATRRGRPKTDALLPSQAVTADDAAVSTADRPRRVVESIL
jgi:hypothetical protein